MRNYKFNFIVFIIIIILFIGVLMVFNTKNIDTKPLHVEEKLTVLQQIKNKKVLDVVILNSPSVYYIGVIQEMGFEYELISAYAKDLGVDLNLTVVYTVAQALQKSREGVGDITVASITITKKREQEFNFGPKYYSIKEQMVCNNKLYAQDRFPSNTKDLIGLNIVVGEDTSYEESLNKLEQEIQHFGFNISDELSTEELLFQVNKNIINCSVADSNLFMINQRYYPELKVSFDVSNEKDLAWVLRDTDDSLKLSLTQWLNRYESDGEMQKLKQFYYAPLENFNYYDIKVFNKRLKSRLPKYEKYFKEAGEMYNIPWQILAAQAYQESHWNPNAKSHTSVRGMMMLTELTAKQMGVKNRVNAKQSIFGGAKYLESLKKRISDDVKGFDRWAFALAAYNVGMGHLHDAQVLARRMNKNPYIWSDIKQMLPLLLQKKYYKTLKYGYARGDEPVKYVDSIQGYLKIIMNNEK